MHKNVGGVRRAQTYARLQFAEAPGPSLPEKFGNDKFPFGYWYLCRVSGFRQSVKVLASARRSFYSHHLSPPSLSPLLSLSST